MYHTRLYPKSSWSKPSRMELKIQNSNKKQLGATENKRR